MHESRGFIYPKHDVHILNSASSLALHQVIDQTDHDQLPGSLIHIQGKIAEIAAPHIGADLRRFRTEYPDKAIMAVKGTIGLFHGSDPLPFPQLGIDGGQNASGKRNNMGGKGNFKI